MANLHYDGFDLGVIDPDYVISSPGQVAPVTTTPFATGRAVQVNSGYLGRTIPATDEVFWGGWIYSYGGGSVQAGMLQFAGDGGTVPHVTIGCTATTIFGRLGDYTGAVLGTPGPWNYPSSFWMHLQVYVKIADSGGRVVIKVNDLTTYDFTGDTKNGGAAASVDSVRMGRLDNSGAFYWDDIWINDASGAAPHNTFYGACRVRTLSPTGAGASTAFTPSTGANYTCVDEQPSSATDYVTATGSVSGTRDTYAMADIATSGLTVLGVRPTAIARKAGADAVSLKPTVRSGGTNYYGTAVGLGTASKPVGATWVTDPSTGVAWTAAGVNALEAGFEVA